MKKIVLAGVISFMCATMLTSCQKRQYVCTCTKDLQTTQHYSGIYRSKGDAKNWCKAYENPDDGTTCEVTN